MAKKSWPDVKDDLFEQRQQNWNILRQTLKFKKDYEELFKQFLRRIRQEKIGRAIKDASYIISLNPFLTKTGWAFRFQTINELAHDSDIRYLFLSSPEGDDLAQRHNLAIPWHIDNPHPPIFIGTKAVTVYRYDEPHHLLCGCFLTLTLDLTKSKTQIMAEVEKEVDRHLPHVVERSGGQS